MFSVYSLYSCRVVPPIILLAILCFFFIVSKKMTSFEFESLDINPATMNVRLLTALIVALSVCFFAHALSTDHGLPRELPS